MGAHRFRKASAHHGRESSAVRGVGRERVPRLAHAMMTDQEAESQARTGADPTFLLLLARPYDPKLLRPPKQHCAGYRPGVQIFEPVGDTS